MKFKNSYNFFVLFGLLFLQQIALASEAFRNVGFLNRELKKAFQERHEFLSPQEEAFHEATSFFVINKDFNLNLLRERNILDFKNVLAVSMGSSSTQWYWLENNEVRADFLSLGTTDFTSPNEFSFSKEFLFLEKMTEFKEAGKHVVLFNAIGHTVNKTQGQPEFWELNDLSEADKKAIFPELQRKSTLEESAVFKEKVINFLEDLIEATESKVTLMSNINEEKKLENAWTVSYKDRIVVDLGGSSFSFKLNGKTLKNGKCREDDAIANNILRIQNEDEALRACEKYVKLILKTAEEANAEDFILLQTGQAREVFFSEEFYAFQQARK